MDAMLDEALDEIDDESDEEKETHKVASNAVFKEVSESPDLTRLELTQEEEDTSIVSESKGLSNTTASEEQSPADVFQSMLKDFIQAEDGGDPDEHLVQFMDQLSDLGKYEVLTVLYLISCSCASMPEYPDAGI